LILTIQKWGGFEPSPLVGRAFSLSLSREGNEMDDFSIKRNTS
jgi:hypothetical protein